MAHYERYIDISRIRDFNLIRFIMDEMGIVFWISDGLWFLHLSTWHLGLRNSSQLYWHGTDSSIVKYSYVKVQWVTSYLMQANQNYHQEKKLFKWSTSIWNYDHSQTQACRIW